tara:strand:- start:3042 stop:3470 length:429 start_codon:yes stop_codon:yes gene_type:complete
MTLVNARAAIEQAVTDAVKDVDPTVKLFYDNTVFKTPGKSVKFVAMSLDFVTPSLQNQGASSDYYEGVFQCNFYVPRDVGSSVFSALSEAIIDGLTSVNASDYADKFSCKPRTTDIVGPSVNPSATSSHFAGLISCQFSANS